jgi:hypothetical protein
MGIDIHLKSVFDMDDDAATKAVLDKVPSPNGTPAEMLAYMDAMFKAYEATGGYYREGHNGLGLLAVLDVNIVEYVADWQIAPGRAADMLAHLEGLSGDYLKKAVRFAASQMPDKPMDAVEGHYGYKYDVLAGLLRKAIERNEPLRASY